MIETRIQTEASPEFSLYAGLSRVQTLDYKTCAVNALPTELHAFFDNNTSLLKQLLDDNLDVETGKENQVLPVDAIYPQDAEGNENTGSTINGIIRAEELMTFVTINPKTGKVMYLARSRPEIKNTNTPGQLDPGTFSHGGLKQAGVINAWRYVADKLGVNDPQLSQEEYHQYLREHPLPTTSGVVEAGQFLIANGSNKRNENKAPGEELEIRTSGLVNVRALVISYHDFQELLRAQEDPSLPIEYTALHLDSTTDTSRFTPKHKATHELLLGRAGEIETQAAQIQSGVQKRTDDIL